MAYILLALGAVMHMLAMKPSADVPEAKWIDGFFFWNASPYVFLILLNMAFKESKLIIIYCAIVFFFDFMLIATPSGGLIFIFLPVWYFGLGAVFAAGFLIFRDYGTDDESDDGFV